MLWQEQEASLLNASGIRNTAGGLTARIESSDRELLISVPISRYIENLDRVKDCVRYNHVPRTILGICQYIIGRSGVSVLEDYHKLLLVTLIVQSEDRLARQSVPRSILSLIPGEFRRILSGIESNPQGFYLYPNDLFLKDLSICSLRAFPAGAKLINEVSGVPRRLLLQGGMRQFIRGLWFFSCRVGGFKPLYEIHMHPRGLGEFTREEWDQAYLRIAELLILNPLVKGFFGGSWFYDPQLEYVSPRLLYLRKRPEDNGAQNFHIGPDDGSKANALAKSETRRKLFEEGRYQPRSYMIVWSRKDMIRWAEAFRSSTA